MRMSKQADGRCLDRVMMQMGFDFGKHSQHVLGGGERFRLTKWFTAAVV